MIDYYQASDSYNAPNDPKSNHSDVASNLSKSPAIPFFLMWPKLRIEDSFSSSI